MRVLSYIHIRLYGPVTLGSRIDVSRPRSLFRVAGYVYVCWFACMQPCRTADNLEKLIKIKLLHAGGWCFEHIYERRGWIRYTCRCRRSRPSLEIDLSGLARLRSRVVRWGGGRWLCFCCSVCWVTSLRLSAPGCLSLAPKMVVWVVFVDALCGRVTRKVKRSSRSRR